MNTRMIIGLCATSLLVWGCGKKKDKAGAEGDDMVDVFKDGAMQRVSFRKLNVKVPAEQARVAPGDAVRADAIVGYYDSGHNYHAERMGSKDMGGAVVNEAAVKGTVEATAGVFVVRKDKLDVAETITAEQAAKFSANPGDVRADAIVGYYDTGHNYHAERMGSKDMGGAVINEAAMKGLTLKTGEVMVIRKDKAEAMQLSVVSKMNPAGLRADAIVGYYDTGHNYHAERMGSKDMGGEVINEAAVKGTTVGP